MSKLIEQRVALESGRRITKLKRKQKSNLERLQVADSESSLSGPAPGPTQRFSASCTPLDHFYEIFPEELFVR